MTLIEELLRYGMVFQEASFGSHCSHNSCVSITTYILTIRLLKSERRATLMRFLTKSQVTMLILVVKEKLEDKCRRLLQRQNS